MIACYRRPSMSKYSGPAGFFDLKSAWKCWGLLLTLGSACQPSSNTQSVRFDAVHQRFVLAAENATDSTLGSPNLEDAIEPSIAFNGKFYLVVWQDRRLGSDYDIFGARFQPDGIPIDPVGFPISVAKGDQGFPRVAFNPSQGGQFLVVWSDERNSTPGTPDIWGARVGLDGTVFDLGGFPICEVPSAKYQSSVTSMGTGFFTTWTDKRLSAGAVYGARVTPAGTVVDPAGVGFAPGLAGYQCCSGVASSGTGAMVVWADNRNTNRAIYFGRLSPDGTVLNAGGTLLTATNPIGQFEPQITYDGAQYVTVFEDSRANRPFAIADIYASRIATFGKWISSDFSVSDTTGFAVSPPAPI